MKIALIGNPNSGKSSLFNLLTGQRQSVSNFPGVTVEKKTGVFNLSDGTQHEIIDFPGIYSLFPNSSDEKIVVNVLTNERDSSFPDFILYVLDVNHLERHLLLATQIADLGIPMLVAVNMIDELENPDKFENRELASFLNCEVVACSSKTGYNIDRLKEKMLGFKIKNTWNQRKDFIYELSRDEKEVSNEIGGDNLYRNKILAHHVDWISHLTEEERKRIKKINQDHSFENIKYQITETFQRFDRIGTVTKPIENSIFKKRNNWTEQIDNVITHKIVGPIIFFGVMFFMFQSIYAWSAYPMEWIENSFAYLGNIFRNILPATWYTDLIVDGILAGVGGVLVFVPQIAILFLLISVLEEIGYMSRAVFMFDNILQKFGLNGRSIVALVSSGACAIPAIMSTRTISNWKERLITIMVSPLISCSARIPVYAVLVGFVVSEGSIGIFNKRGIVFMGLYLLGIIAALSFAIVLKYIIKSEGQSSLMMELPIYKRPLFRNVYLNVREKTWSFIKEAGKVIVVISIALWFLASYGPGDSMQMAEIDAKKEAAKYEWEEEEIANHIASKKMEVSYAGYVGKFIEPVIKPLGFDWKIGIALITSFAAREVFVGTMATIYSIGSEADELTLREKMEVEKFDGTEIKVYGPATSLSLLIFYVFAMQCMSTLAVVKKETFSWKWPIIQFVVMGLLAYFGSLLVYQLMS